MKNTNHRRQGIFGKNADVGTHSTDEELTYKQPIGTRFVKNNQTVLGGQYSGIMKSGRSVTVSGDSFIPVPINYTLGSDTKQTATLGDGWVDNGGDSYTASDATSSLSDLSSTSNVPVLINYTISNYSAGDLEGNTANGDYETVSENEELVATGFSGDVLINSVKEITQVQGSVTYQKADGTFEQIGADGVGSKELVINGDFSDGLSGTSVRRACTIHVENEQLHQLSDGTHAYPLVAKSFEEPISNNTPMLGSVDIIDFDSNGVTFRCSDIGGSSIISNTAGNISQKFKFKNSADNKILLELRKVDGEVGRYGIWDNCSLKKILPLSVYLELNNNTYSNIVRLWDAQFTQEDLEFFNNDPENIIKWYLGEVTIPSGLVKGANDRLYACTEESGDILLEMSDTDNITIQGTYNRELNSQYGVQTLLLELNTAGVPTGVTDSGFVFGEEYIQTDFRLFPSDGYCVEEVTNLYTYAFTSDGAVWKDGMLYDSYPLPTDGTLLTLGKTLLNGNEVAKRDNTKVYSYVPDEYVVSISESGSPLENHPYWYKVANDESKIGYNRFGRVIVAKDHQNKNESQLAIGDNNGAYQYKNATITAEYLSGSTEDNSYLVPFCKILNGNNFVGARMRNGKVEVIQKKDNSYTTLGSIDSTELGEWKIEFDDIHIKVYINKNLVLEVDSTIPNFGDTGYFGISDYSWAEADKEIVMDYLVTEKIALLVDENGNILVDDNDNFLIGV